MADPRAQSRIKRSRSWLRRVASRPADETSPERTSARDRAEADALQLAAIVSSTSDAVISATIDGCISTWNLGAERLYGYTAQEAVGAPVTLISPPGLQNEFGEINDRWRLGEAIVDFETVRRRKDGTLVEVSITLTPILDSAGRPVGGSAIARDITDRKRAEVASARLAALVETSSDAIISSTLDGVFTSWNPAAERLYGRTAAEMVGHARPSSELVPADHLDDYPELLRRVLAGEQVDHFETVRRRPDGSRFDVSLTLSAIRDTSGEITGLSSIGRDITEAKRAENALRDAEELLTLAFDHSALGMTISNPQRGVERLNRAFADMIGYTVDELLADQRLGRSTHPEDLAADRANVGRLLSGEVEVAQWEKRYMHRDGHAVWASVSASVLRTPDGTISHIVGQIQDVSERRRMEEQLRHLADHDPLTGLSNRRRFDTALASQVQRSKRYDEQATLLIVDLDNFKQINDAFGHRMGDEVLQATAAAIGSRIRSTDLAARIGGDEFAVLLAHAGPADASAVREAIEHAIAAIDVPGAARPVRPTASIGVAPIDATTDDAEAVLMRADLTMYEAKRRRALSEVR